MDWGRGSKGLDPLHNATVAGYLRPQHLECGSSGQKAETLRNADFKGSGPRKNVKHLIVSFM